MKFVPFKEYRGLRKEIYILCLGRMMTNLGSMIWPVLTLILNQKLGMNATEVALYILIYSIVAIPIMFIGGKLADHFNKKNIIVICDLISITGYIVCAFIPLSFTSIVIVSLAAMCQTMEYPSYDSLVSDMTTSKDRERAYSLTYLCGNLGMVASPTLAGLLFKDYLNISFLISGCAVLLSTIFIFIFIKNISVEKDTSKEAEYEKAIDKKVNVFKYIFSNKVLLLFVIIGGLSELIYSMYGYLMPLDLAKTFGDNGGVIFGTMSTVNCVVVVVFTSIITRIFSKWIEIQKLMFGEFLILFGYLLFMFLSGVIPVCYVAMVIFTFGEIFSTISNSPFGTKRMPASHRGRIIAVKSIVCSIFASVMQLAVGAIFDSFGAKWAWGFILILGVLVLVLMFVMFKFDRRLYKNLYHGIVANDGSIISITRPTLVTYKIFRKGLKNDPDLFINKEDFKECVYDKNEVKDYYKKNMADPTRQLLIIYKGIKPIGEILIKNIDREKKTGEMSIILQSDEYKNKGYGSIAEKVFVKVGFERYGFESFTANTLIGNTRSQHVLEKTGFKKIKEDEIFVSYYIDKELFLAQNH